MYYLEVAETLHEIKIAFFLRIGDQKWTVRLESVHCTHVARKAVLASVVNFGSRTYDLCPIA